MFLSFKKIIILFLAAIVLSPCCVVAWTPPTPLPRTSTTRLYAELDKGFNLLELSGLFMPKQGVIVKTATESWKFVWKRMMAELAPQDKAGNYQRQSYTFSTVSENTLDLSDSSSKGRYHLYVGNPCPWCHRALLAMQWLGLEDTIAVTRLEDNPQKASRGGWIFSQAQPDRVFGGCSDLRELYETLSPGYKGRCTAPLLVDTRTKKVVSNESSDMVRLFNNAARRLRGNDDRDLYPAALAAEIDATNEWVYKLVNNGVYRCGFATTQSAYEQASADVRAGLARLNERLSTQPYLCGNQFTEADLRLLPTVLRFDGAYAPLFRAGGGHARIRDYPFLQEWLQRCWKTYPAVATSIDIADACESYYRQLFPLNPGGIVPYPPISAELLGLK
jgi:putative glutathione S-transferase